MSGNLGARLQKWLQQRMSEPPIAIAFRLRHVDASGNSELVAKYKVAGDAVKEAKRISEAIAEASIEHVEAFTSRQRYKVFALADFEGKKTLEGAFSIGLTPKNQSLSVGESEPATPQGLLGQLMHHNAQMMRITTDSWKSTLETLQAENQSLRQYRDADDSAHWERRTALENMLSQENLRKIDFARFEKDEGYKKELLQLFFGIAAPALKQGLGNKLAELLGGGDQKTMAQAIIDDVQDIVKAIPEDVAEKLIASLPEDKQQKLMRFLPAPKEEEKKNG